MRFRTAIIRKWIIADWRIAMLGFLLASGQASAQIATKDGSQCTVDADCDNGLFCDGAETCNTETGSCSAGTAPDCDDGVSCTIDACSEAIDSCRHAPNDAACGDGLFCNGTETCDSSLGCQEGADPCDGSACDETTDACLECLVDADCDDGLFCYGSETCDGGACRAGSAPCPGQACDESNGECTAGDGCTHHADFESGAGSWTGDTGDCTAGDFVAGEPETTTWQAGGGGQGNAFFTAPNPFSIGRDDVDGGTCEALSPVVSCGGHAAAEVTIDYFHGQRDAGDDANDGFSIEVLSDGAVIDTLVSIGDVTTHPSWTTTSTTIDNPGDLRLRVRASDAANTGDIVEGGIDNVRICANDPVDGPTVTITSPGNGEILPADTAAELRATATDPQDGDISGRISWRSSIDGYLGTCEPVWPILSPGTHILTASVTDSQGFCSSTQIMVVVIGDPGGPGPPPTCPTVLPTEADLLWRQIADKVDPNGACPAVPGWIPSQLNEVPGEPIHCVAPPLRTTCIYTFAGTGAVSARAIYQLDNAPGLTCHHPTRMATGPASGPLPASGLPTKSLEDDLAGCFQDAAGGVPAASGLPSLVTIRMALLDTAATMDQNPKCVLSGTCAPPPPPEPRPPSPHGPSLGALADALLCGDAMACGVKVTSQLAMPFKDFEREIPQPLLPNGYVGTIDELASAIWREYDSFHTARTEQNIVFNLSLAWRRQFGGSELAAEAMALDVRAVREILRFVVADGALVVAAAGNKPDDCHAALAGPLYPAAWESRRAPGPQGGYRPLLYAVAAVHDDDRPLVNAQPDSLPPLVAFGDHGVAPLSPSSPGGPFSGTLTGTSVSALVTAAAAATLWSREPTLDAAGVMDRLYTNAIQIAGAPAPDFCLSSPPGPAGCQQGERPQVRRVSPCSAVGAGCVPAPASCRPPVDGSVRFIARSPTGSTCPLVPPPSLLQEPWVFPQPGSTLCPNCGFDVSSRRVAGKIGDGSLAAGAGSFVSEMTIEVCGETYQLESLTIGPDIPIGTSFYAVLPGASCTPDPNPVLSGTVTLIDSTGMPRQFTASAPLFVPEPPQSP